MKYLNLFFLLILTVAITNVKAQSTSEEFVLHEVKKGETLYGLSRKYNVPVEKIVNLNEGADQGLSIGQKLRIPSKNKPFKATKDKVHVVGEKETLYSIATQYGVTVEDLKKWNDKKENTLAIGEELTIKLRKGKDRVDDNIAVLEGKKFHSVAEKETLYSISRQYGVTTEDLKLWNKLSDETLSIGQKLIVGELSKVKSETNKEEVKEASPIAEVKTEEIKEEIKETPEPVQETKKEPKSIEVYQDDQPRVVKNASGFEEIVQTGLAELIEGTGDTRKYLALHSKAKVGTIMKVRNEMNNQMVFVRVIGTIPDTGDNDKILIKLSKAAYDRLGALDKRFRVEVSYMP